MLCATTFYIQIKYASLIRSQSRNPQKRGFGVLGLSNLSNRTVAPSSERWRWEGVISASSSLNNGSNGTCRPDVCDMYLSACESYENRPHLLINMTYLQPRRVERVRKPNNYTGRRKRCICIDGKPWEYGKFHGDYMSGARESVLMLNSQTMPKDESMKNLVIGWEERRF